MTYRLKQRRLVVVAGAVCVAMLLLWVSMQQQGPASLSPNVTVDSGRQPAKAAEVPAPAPKAEEPASNALNVQAGGSFETKRSPIDPRVRLGNMRDYIQYLSGTPDTEAMKQFKNLHAGKRAFIIGNGPSLNNVDVSKLKDEVTFGVNSIFYNFDDMGFKPTYYVIEDLLVAEDRADEINKLTGLTRFFGTYLAALLHHNEGVYYLNVTMDYNDKKSSWPRFSKDSSKEMFVGGSVTYLCLQLAYYMGIETVYMVGFDHNYVVPKSVATESTNKNTIVSTEADVNHFHPEYFGKGKRWHLPRTDRMDRGFARARETFEAEGRGVVNITPGGHLEAFPRVDFREVVKGERELQNGPSASVIVCLHCSAEVGSLEPSVAALIKQEGVEKSKYEVVYILNGCPDDAILKTKRSNLEATFKKLQCTNCMVKVAPMTGLSICRNEGILQTFGKYVLYVDADATVHKRWVASFVRAFEENDDDVWMAGGHIFDARKHQELESTELKMTGDFSLQDYGDKPRLLHPPTRRGYIAPSRTGAFERLLGCNVGYKRVVFSRVGWFDPNLGRKGQMRLGFEENDLTFRIEEHHKKVLYDPSIATYHHFEDSRLTPEYHARAKLFHLITVAYLQCKYLGGSSEQLIQQQLILDEGVERDFPISEETNEYLSKMRTRLNDACSPPQ